MKQQLWVAYLQCVCNPIDNKGDYSHNYNYLIVLYNLGFVRES